MRDPEAANTAKRLLFSDSEPPPPSSLARNSPPPAESGLTPAVAAGLKLEQMLTDNDNQGLRRIQKSSIKANVNLAAEADALARQAPRRWREGDTYTPHDLTAGEMMKWKKPRQPTKDVFDLLGLNPLDHYKVCVCSSMV